MLQARRVLGVLLFFAWTAIAAPQATPAGRKPNFVVIFIDDMGYGDIGPFGSTLNHTPHLDRMAAEGMKLTSFYVAAPVCTPSRAALLTGSYPKRVGLAEASRQGVFFPGDAWGLNPSEVTIAEVLKDAGYTTGCFGKWHLGDQPEFLPTAQGFDEYYGIPYSNDMWPLHPNVGRGGIWDFPPLPLLRNSNVVGQVDDMHGQGMLCKLFTDEATGFIRRNKDKPFFAYLPHAYIHHPRGVRESFSDQEDSKPVDWQAVAREPWEVDLERRTKAQIEEVDWSAGQILDTIRELGIAENTLVLFTSDNGGSRGCVNTPLRGAKGSTWEGGMREPTLAWWPGRIPAGSASDEVATTMDLLPTFAALSGGRVPEDRTIDGCDISDLLLGRASAKSPHNAFYYYFRHELQAVRSGKWKRFAKDGALYELDADMGETSDVSAQHPEVVSRLSKLLAEARADLGDGPGTCPNCRTVGKTGDPSFLIPRPAAP